MNIFIIAAQNIADTKYKPYIDALVRTAKESHHKVFADHVYETKIDDPLEFAHKMNDIRKQSNALIAEVSLHSTGVGHDIRLALSEKKPVLVVYHKDSEEKVSEIIRSIKGRLITIAPYETKKELQEITQKFLTGARQKMDSKFILIIPAEIDRYLEWASDYKRMHKAQVVRKAIENYMQKDQDWREYLKDEG